MARPSKSNPKGEQKSPKKTPEAINKLLEGFRNDFTVAEACSCAGISIQTYHNRIDKDKKLLDEIECAKQRCFTIAKRAVSGKILNDGEFALKWLKNRQNKLYSERNESEPTNVNVNINRDTLSVEELDQIIKGQQPTK